MRKFDRSYFSKHPCDDTYYLYKCHERQWSYDFNAKDILIQRPQKSPNTKFDLIFMKIFNKIPEDDVDTVNPSH